MFYLIPFDLNTSAFTQVLLPIHSIGNKEGADLSQPHWFRSQSAINQTNYPSTFVSVGTPSAAATVTHITAGTLPLLDMV